MKKSFLYTTLWVITGILFFQNLSAQNVAINNTNSAPASTAILDVSSTTKGILIPRMTTTECQAISSPASGLIIYDTVKKGFVFYDGAGWQDITSLNNNIGWKTTGNAGTNSSTNFIGTTDNKPLMFRTNNTLTGKWDYIFANYFVGYNAGLNTTGNNNTGMGYEALKTNGTGYENAAIGYKALTLNTTGTDNVAAGANALFANTTGTFNVAIGSDAMRFNDIGQVNTAVGYQSLYNNNGGNGNTALGNGSLFTNLDGGNNVAIGSNALRFNISGQFNTGCGINALYDNTTGANNIGMGVNTLRENTVGYSNVAIGRDALYKNNNRSNNVAIGDSSLRNNSTGLVNSYESINNTAVGSKSLFTNGTGFKNTAMGFQALYSNTSGYRNTSVGNAALRANSSGSQNVAVGDSALALATAFDNTAIGSQALKKNTVGFDNTAVGRDAGIGTTTGDGNTMLGYQSGKTNTVGNKNTTIGNAANVFYNNLQYSTAIGAEAVSDCSNCLVLGGTGTASTFVGINESNPNADLNIKQKTDYINSTQGIKLERSSGGHWWRAYVGADNWLCFTLDEGYNQGQLACIDENGNYHSLSDARVKKDILTMDSVLYKIKQLNPVTFRYLSEDENGPLQYGFIAQEVQPVFPDLVRPMENGKLTISYTEFTSIAIKAIQEQQTMIDTLQTQNQELMMRLQNLENAVAGLKSK